MVDENDYLAPIDPDHLNDYKINKAFSNFSEKNDMWALGITTLCYLFNEEFSVFYDWNKKAFNKNKFESFLKILYNVNYDKKVLSILTELLNY